MEHHGANAPVRGNHPSVNSPHGNADLDRGRYSMTSQREPSRPIVSEFATDPEMAELVQMFITELPGRVASLHAAWTGKKITELTRMAHQLKGASAGYGFPTIGQAASALESRLRQLDVATAQASVDKLAAEYREL